MLVRPASGPAEGRGPSTVRRHCARAGAAPTERQALAAGQPVQPDDPVRAASLGAEAVARRDDHGCRRLPRRWPKPLRLRLPLCPRGAASEACGDLRPDPRAARGLAARASTTPCSPMTTDAFPKAAIWNIGFVQDDTVIWPQAPMLAGTGQALIQRGLDGCGGWRRSSAWVACRDLADFDAAFIVQQRPWSRSRSRPSERCGIRAADLTPWRERLAIKPVSAASLMRGLIHGIGGTAWRFPSTDLGSVR